MLGKRDPKVFSFRLFTCTEMLDNFLKHFKLIHHKLCRNYVISIMQQNSVPLTEGTLTRLCLVAWFHQGNEYLHCIHCNTMSSRWNL